MADSVKCVTDALLRKNILHCAICKNLLLSTPVMLVENVGNLCSTCYNENFLESKCVQNTALEELVTTLSYPCRFRENGCNHWSCSADLLDHEENCKFRSKRCPMHAITLCTWEGFPVEFVGHFLNCHGEHVINFENSLFFLDITFDDEALIKLLVMKNIILLLKMQLSLGKNKLLYIVCNVKDDDNSNFDYSVKHKGNSDNYIKTRSRVVDSNYAYKNLEECDAVSVDLVSLRQTVKVTNRITNIFKIKTYDTPVHYIGERMLQYFECPVCKSFMKPPIFQCQSGHSICNTCKPRLEKCPTCRAAFGMTRNYSLEGLTAGVSYPCAYHDFGCMLSLSPIDISRHEAVCPYKPYNCPMPQCTMSGTQDVIINHLHDFHADYVLQDASNEARFSDAKHQGYTDTFRLSDTHHSLASYNHILDRRILIEFDHIFRLTCKRMNEYCMWAAEVIGVQSELKLNFVYEVSIIDLRRPEKRLIRTDYCLNEMPEDDLFKKCIMFPNSILSAYSHNGMVSFQFKIKKGIKV
ncbi:uncharacterized protein LOC126735479 [Anthonomus grandis grandis]|uniref:uncharacterized protein LOC126735479 n=1 Tax=Anthonomus grandis grandis TaxID=2921223 RepID=UPI00216671FB|nr:uncharacterized protein LOC126735479 [Anthonomus grandis grandis]XP_050295439.1 uncharacterized protein LOC126735479 [Anthonomus grandis grandis]